MNLYQEAEKQLAELLGWATFTADYSKEPSGFFGDNVSLKVYNEQIPSWTQDDAEAFKLIVKYNIDVKLSSWCASALWDYTYDVDKLTTHGFQSSQIFKRHSNDKYLATRYAIVLAVIEKLKGEKV